MKNCLPTLILSIAFLMPDCPSAGAQDYVVTTRGDSLTGEVKPLLYGPEKRVQIESADREKTTFSIFQVRSFSSEGDIYHPVKGETGYVFMKLIHPGYLSLYAYQLENQTRFDGLFLKKLDGDNIVVPNLGFKKYMSRFLDDCPDVAEKIQSGDLGRKDLTEMVNAYNACVANRTVDHGKVIVEREQEKTKLSVWDSLAAEVKDKEFTEKNDALEMIAEIRKKIERNESIPNFLVEGLKSSLKDTGLSQRVQQAIDQMN